MGRMGTPWISSVAASAEMDENMGGLHTCSPLYFLLSLQWSTMAWAMRIAAVPSP